MYREPTLICSSCYVSRGKKRVSCLRERSANSRLAPSKNLCGRCKRRAHKHAQRHAYHRNRKTSSNQIEDSERVRFETQSSYHHACLPVFSFEGSDYRIYGQEWPRVKSKISLNYEGI